jgi:Tfp pilus assembly protein PilV
MVEVLVAMLLLLVGMLATFILVGSANATLSKTRAREAATNLARELLEGSRDTTYSKIGTSGWFTSQLQGTSGGSGTVTAVGSNGQSTTVTRRGVTYSVTVTWCSLDDSGDSYGSHGTSVSWCSDSASTGTADPQPEDFKRVTVTINWSFAGRTQPTMVQTATFAATGAVAGPTTTNLVITSPSGLSSTAPIITTNPTGGIVTFQGTSVGASDMKFFVDSSEILGTTTNNGNGTWNFNWNITTVPDGVYTITAVAVDALGNRGPQRALQVKLARAAPDPAQNATGGYNYVYSSGNRIPVVELTWDASVSGLVTGYSVTKGSTTVCSQSASTDCIDLSPAASGSTTYTIKTHYTDAAGNAQTVSTAYSVTAPILVPTYLGNIDSQICGTGSSGSPLTLTVPSGGVAAGSRVIVRLELRGTSSSVATISDTRGNSWAADLDNLNIDERVIIWSSNLTTALSSGDSIRLTYPSSTSSAAVADAFTMVAASNAVDATGNGSGNSASPSASVTTTAANELVVGAVGIFNTTSSPTQPSGWSGLPTALGTSSTSPGCSNGSSGNSSNVGGYRVASTTGSYTYSPSVSSGRWAAGIVAYKVGTPNYGAPATPTGLTGSDPGDGTTVLTWTKPSGTPAPDFYRIYRDGINYTDRYDTVADNGTSTVTYTDTNTGGTNHTYRVTAVSQYLAESSFAGPVTQ